jgi:hypothetical protein
VDHQTGKKGVVDRVETRRSGEKDVYVRWDGDTAGRSLGKLTMSFVTIEG